MVGLLDKINALQIKEQTRSLFMFWLRSFLLLVVLSIGTLIFSAPLKAEETALAQDLQIGIESLDHSQYPTVTVTVTVADKSGAPVFGLDPTLFSVTVMNEPPIAVTGKALYEISRKPLNLVLALDRSFHPEVAQQWDSVKQIARIVQQSMRPGDQLIFVVFDKGVYTVESLKKLQELPFDATNTALNRAIEYSTELIIGMANRGENGERSQIIVIANSVDNTWRLAHPPPPFEQLRRKLITNDAKIKPELHVYCFGITLPFFESDYSKSLRALAQDSGPKGSLVVTSTVGQVVSDVGQTLQAWQGPARYKLTFQAEAQVNKEYKFQVRLKDQASEPKSFTPLATDIPVGIEVVDQKNSEMRAGVETIVPRQPNGLTFAVTNNWRIKPLKTQITLNDVLSSTYSFNDSKNLLQLSPLAPGIRYTLSVTMTDPIGNPGRETKIFFQVAQPLDVKIEPDLSGTYNVGQSDHMSVVYTVTVSGEFPVTLTLRAAKEGVTKTINTFVVTNSAPVMIGGFLSTYISKTYTETYTYAKPECPTEKTALQKMSEQLPESLQPPVVWLLSWVEPLRCIIPIHRTIWANLSPQRETQVDTFKLTYSAVDRLNQRRCNAELCDGNGANPPIDITVNYASRPSFLERLAYCSPVLLIDTLFLLLLLLLGIWLRRRFVAAHETSYYLDIKNEGNLATRYEIWAFQPIIQSKDKEKVLSFEPNTLKFSFLYKGEKLMQATTSAQNLAVLNALTPQEVATLDGKTLQTAQQVNQIDARQHQYDIHQSLQAEGAGQLYEISVGESPHFQTEIVPAGQSLALELRIQTQRRHWWRKNYTFAILSRPQESDKSRRKKPSQETIRFGGILSPKRIDRLSPRRKRDTPATPSLGSPLAIK